MKKQWMGWTIAAVAMVATAQDTRKVTEPVIPSRCAVVKAALVSANGGLAEADEARLDNSRLQAAFDACPKGQAVELAADGPKNAFLIGSFRIKSGTTLLVDKGVTVFGSRNPKDYEVSAGSCGKVDEKGGGCNPLLTVNGPDTAIMGDGVIDGRGGAKLIGKDKTWWQLAADARAGGRQNNPRMLIATNANNFILYRITFRNSPNFHVVVNKTDGFTAWGVKIDTPSNARNTDGIDPSGSKNVTLTQCFIRAGDDNVAIKAGGAGAASYMTFAHNHFYSGHGMSIGSETYSGANNILVTDLMLDGTTAGLRIKSDVTRGGLVHDVLYQDVCMRDVKNPIAMDPFYEGKNTGERKPAYKRIFIKGVHSLTPGKSTFAGLDAEHAMSLQLDGVVIDGLKPEDIKAQYASFLLGPGPVNFQPAGPGVILSKAPAGQGAAVPACKADRFVPFPVIQ